VAMERISVAVKTLEGHSLAWSSAMTLSDISYAYVISCLYLESLARITTYIGQYP